MVKAKQTIKAYHDPNPVYYTLSEAELNQLREKARIPERENTFFLLGLMIPSVINLVAGLNKTSTATDWTFETNLLIVIVTAVLCIFQGKEWYAKRSSYKDLIESLSDRPQIELHVGRDAAGYLAPPIKTNAP